MKPALLLLSSLLLLSCRGGDLPAPKSVPQRIVSVTITGDVLLEAMVDSSRVLAVCKLADDSGIHESAGLFPGKPRIGPDLERILLLRPDLVLLGSFNDPNFVHAIARTGVATEVLESPNSLDKIRLFLGKVARRLGEPAKGDSLVAWMDSIVAGVRSKGERCREHPRVAYWSEGQSAGDSSTIHDLLLAAGARNAVAEAGRHGAVSLAVEDMVRLDPDWILRSSWEAGGRMKDLPVAFANLRAVREGRVAVVPGRVLLSTSHRSALGAEALLSVLHAGDPCLTNSVDSAP
ncbi:MAG: ABC transporter substrate-binding protein [Fibrobacteria bacterium]|nr:ABC transporter substrate-binding protein [Fibrobacteria bacterium]